MAIAISEDHLALAATVSDFLGKKDALASNRALLEADVEQLPPFWSDVASLGWLGLHLPEAVGGSGFDMPELCVVVEETGRAIFPGPFVPTVILSATLSAIGDEDLRKKYLPGLADGTVIGAVGFSTDLSFDEGTASGTAETVLSGALADLLMLPSGDDVLLIDARANSDAMSFEVPQNVDPSRRAANMSFNRAPAVVLSGGRRTFLDLARVVLAAEATGVARECTERAAAYASVRTQFGRQIGTFQAVKHHCANMALAVELATAASWDAARAVNTGGDQLSFAASIAATMAVPAALANAETNIQVHGGIGYTWEHDAHLFLRRALAISALVGDVAPAEEVTSLARRGVTLPRVLELPAEAEVIRSEVRSFVERVRDLDEDAQRTAMLEEKYAQPHWPEPWGRNAGAIEQLVIEQEFGAAAISRPTYDPITSYVTLTLIQQGTEDQVARWVGPVLRGELKWCQLFSEPDAGSDAAGIKTRALRADGGWVVTGQKVWTSGAKEATFGLATVRTNTEVPKHKGITVMVVDMHDPGIEIRPLRQITGSAGFNEVFLNDVFVPDENVIGPVDGGWKVARATLGNESLSIGAATGQASPIDDLIAAFDHHPELLFGGSARVGRCIASTLANGSMNLRSLHRAVAGSGPGPEGAITKLAFSESLLDMAHAMAELDGPSLAYMTGGGVEGGTNLLGVRVWTIGGGTSEIKRNQIGERILGLPRDPLIG